MISNFDEFLWDTLSDLSKVSSSRWVRSQAMYSSAASVILGHQDRSRLTNFLRFSATNSIPSSVTLLQPDKDRIVRFGSEWTGTKIIINFIGTPCILIDIMKGWYDMWYLGIKEFLFAAYQSFITSHQKLNFGIEGVK